MRWSECNNGADSWRRAFSGQAAPEAGGAESPSGGGAGRAEGRMPGERFASTGHGVPGGCASG